MDCAKHLFGELPYFRIDFLVWPIFVSENERFIAVGPCRGKRRHVAEGCDTYRHAAFLAKQFKRGEGSIVLLKEKPLDQMKKGALVRNEVNALRNFAVYQTHKDISIRCLQLFYIFLVF